MGKNAAPLSRVRIVVMALGKGQKAGEELSRYNCEVAVQMARLGEIYLHARFRNAVPAKMVEEFDRLEPEVLVAMERLKEAETTRG